MKLLSNNIGSESILDSIKKLIGIEDTETYFDSDIVTGVNSAFSSLNQIGIGPDDGFSISDNTKVWNDYLTDVRTLELVKSYVHLKTKLLFDPPSSSSIVDIINKEISEFEWRLNVIKTTKQEVQNG